ncbi:hypothetical protein H6G33_09415 [Calothrix sp. FACHB-1219]|uniref:hypothetical protein n=1 Tax=unclassified Calothrix TaxID=2619626 RepID=UPI00168767E3|nr:MULTISPECIES: hypothetical protein [unclassified Calothrix]MBD2201564.1 hypothetical protein [Calothrix sp. FACHB-168]MBD2217250.1 hypothetical protein [Calothrix sp. FACHB-1219]
MYNIKLPSGKDISFRAPSFKDRRDILREFDKTAGYLAEDLLAVKCLTHVDNIAVEQYWEAEPITIFDSWDLRDQSFYMEVFMNMFSLDEKARKAAEDQAKKLMGVTGDTTQKPKAAKLPA